MRAAFFANHNKTYFLREVASHLAERGHTTLWISPGRRLANWLRQSGIPADDILDLTTLSSRWRRESSLPPLSPDPESPLELNAMIAADRFLRERRYDEAVSYLAVCGQEIAAFAERRQVDAVLGEQTYAIELMAARVLAAQGIPYLAPHTIRVPSTRFALFKGPSQERFATSLQASTDDEAAASRVLAAFNESPGKPHYFGDNQGRLLPDPSWLASPFKQLWIQARDPHELNRPSLRWLLRARTRQVVNGQLNRFYPFAAEDVLSRRPYVLLTLHRQPEASLDVLGYKFADQLDLARAIAVDLPPGWRLAVKEHANGIGDRGPTFYRRLRSIPGVELIRPQADALFLARGATLTVTVSGTIALEAGLQGLRAATFAKMFFARVLVASGLNPYGDDLRRLMASLASTGGEAQPDGSRVQYMAHALANSREGLIGAPGDTPGVMAPANVQSVARGLEELLPTALPRRG